LDRERLTHGPLFENQAAIQLIPTVGMSTISGTALFLASAQPRTQEKQQRPGARCLHYAKL